MVERPEITGWAGVGEERGATFCFKAMERVKGRMDCHRQKHQTGWTLWWLPSSVLCRVAISLAWRRNIDGEDGLEEINTNHRIIKGHLIWEEKCDAILLFRETDPLSAHCRSGWIDAGPRGRQRLVIPQMSTPHLSDSRVLQLAPPPHMHATTPKCHARHVPVGIVRPSPK